MRDGVGLPPRVSLYDGPVSRLPVVIIGAGAAGLMAAISSARAGAPTQLLDRRRRVGAKILMSGGTRCNVTNQDVSERDFNASSSPFVRNVLKQFTPGQARAFFADVGVELKLEPTGKYFPVSDSAKDVLAGLLRAVDTERVELQRESLVTGVERDESGFVVKTSAGNLPAGAVVIATGGLSYPETGSDGIGYRIATELGHTIVRTSAALTPLIASPAIHASLSGLAVNAELRVVSRARTLATRCGSLLFTHTGYSGPVALDISRHWERTSWVDPDVEIRASFGQGRSRDEIGEHVLSEARRAPRRHVANLLAEYVPLRVADLLMQSSEVEPGTMLATLGRDARLRLIRSLTDFRLPVRGIAGYGKAEVTAGGVPLGEVVARSMASKVVEGLYFAGEILDVDGYIGGYNFQWAWSSGWVAGAAAARHVLAT